MSQNECKVCIRQIKQSGFWTTVIVSSVALYAFAEEIPAHRIWIGLLMASPVLFSFAIKGILACLDLIHCSTRSKTVTVKHVCLDVYVTFGEEHLYGEICYLDPNVTKQSKLKNLPMLRLIHDIELMGEPQESYFKNHQYKITYLRFSRIVVKIEDLTSNASSIDNERRCRELL